MDNNVCEWFSVEKIEDNLFQITEPFFFEGNRCNIWLLRGGHSDLIIDCGLGVCNLRKFLEEQRLIDPKDKPHARPCFVILTHIHFDHSGGAKDFESVYIHKEEVNSLLKANSIYTLNWVKAEHFKKKPTPDFDASTYRVEETNCMEVRDGQRLMIGEEEYVEIIHLPGHSTGSVAIHYPQGKSVFVGDIVYECGQGSGLLDWLPSSSVNQYIRSCRRLGALLDSSSIEHVYPGHFHRLTTERTQELLSEYMEAKKGMVSKASAAVLKMFSALYFKCR